MKLLYGLFVLVLLGSIAVQPVVAQIGPIYDYGLTFTSQPPKYGRVGLPYVYTAVAKSMDANAVIHYFSDPTNPAGFGIDSLTGVVNWTPAARGFFPVQLFARSDKGEMGVQRFGVMVTTGNGVVQGKVQDTTGAGIPRVVIEAVQASNPDPINRVNFTYATKTDDNGNYRIANIEPGLYKLHAISTSPLYASQWYDGKATPEEANRIQIPDSPSVTIANFILRGGVGRLPLLTVSGTVTDTASNILKDAMVYFVRAGFALNSNSTVEDFRQMFDMSGSNLDFRMEGFSPHVFRTPVDSLGKYTVKLPQGTYVAFARAPGYAVEFYLHQSSFLTATRLSLTTDLTDISFTLAKLPDLVYGTIKGSVLDTAKGVGVRSRIVAIRDKWTVEDFYPRSRSYTVDTDELGAYVLENLLPGSYIVFALPMGNYAPAFYASDSPTLWHRASRVNINGNTVEGIDIYVHEIPARVHGYAAITGRISLSGGAPSAVAGTIVCASQNSEVAGYGIADATGQYVINGLAPGTYTVTADLPGTESTQSKSATLSYAANGAPVGAVVDLNLSLVTDVTEQGTGQPESFGLSQNYPNPFNPSTSISYQLSTGGRVDLRVFDMLGREVAVLVNGVQNAGRYTVSFDASSLSSGMYLYRLSTGSMTASKKMLLMK
jgi:protocatechuate 3,4-dioxygenase beta subunit